MPIPAFITTWLAKKAITKTTKIILLVILVMVSVYGIHYTGITRERARLQPVIAEKDKQIAVLVDTVQDNSTTTQNVVDTIKEIYKVQLEDLQGDYNKDVKDLNNKLADYESQRLRDKDSLRTAEGRIASLSEAAERLTSTVEEARVLSGRLEQLETGVHHRLVVPAEQDLARLKLAQKYIAAAKAIKEKYDELRLKNPIKEVNP